MIDWAPLLLSLKLAVITTTILLLVSIPIGLWLSSTKNKFKPVIESFVSLPLVLPPTVLGFYLLIAFSPANNFGRLLDSWFGLRLVFSFEGLVVASMIYSLPFMVHPLQSGFKSLPRNLVEASYLMGKSKLQTLWYIQLPNIRASIITGIVLTFAHTIGEFGVVLMIGGNIPDETRVVSIAIFDQVESMNYQNANQYALILFVLTFAILLVTYSINNGFLNKFWK